MSPCASHRVPIQFPAEMRRGPEKGSFMSDGDHPAPGDDPRPLPWNPRIRPEIHSLRRNKIPSGTIDTSRHRSLFIITSNHEHSPPFGNPRSRTSIGPCLNPPRRSRCRCSEARHPHHPPDQCDGPPECHQDGPLRAQLSGPPTRQGNPCREQA